jgi:hypothetical protein
LHCNFIIKRCSSITTKLPQDKFCRINDLWYVFLDRRTCTKRELLSLLGHLNYATRVIIHNRSLIRLLPLKHIKSTLHCNFIIKRCSSITKKSSKNQANVKHVSYNNYSAKFNKLPHIVNHKSLVMIYSQDIHECKNRIFFISMIIVVFVFSESFFIFYKFMMMPMIICGRNYSIYVILHLATSNKFGLAQLSA